MTRILTAAQVAGIVASQRPPAGTTVAEWVAKARQENSTFDADKFGVINPWDVGVWQINVKANADLIPEASVSLDNARSAMRSPLRNFAVAKAIYARQGWQAWRSSGGKPRPTDADNAAAGTPDYSIATSGGAVRDPKTGEVGPEPGVESGLGLGNPLEAIGDLVGAIGGFLEWVTDPNTWKRVAFVVAGGGIVLVGVAAIVRGTEFGQTVESTATSVATKGVAGRRSTNA